MPPDVEVPRTRSRHRLVAAGLAWCVIFGGLHVYWAVGGRDGLGSQADNADAALGTWWFALYNGGVAAACALAFALGCVELLTPRHPLARLRPLVLVLAALLALRGAIGLVDLAVSASSGTLDSPPVLIAVEFAFLVGAGILALLAQRE